MKSNLRIRIDHYLRRRRKGLLKLHAPLNDFPELIFLSTERPVNLAAISYELLQQKMRIGKSWVDEIEQVIEELLSMKGCNKEAANIHVSCVRALVTNDTERAINLGLKYVQATRDERVLKTTTNLLLSQRRKDDAWDLLQSFNNSKWSIDKREEILRKDGMSEHYDSNYLDLIGRAELEVDCRPAVLIYADVNANIIDGSSIWLSSIAEAFAENNLDIHLLLKSNIERDVLLTPLYEKTEIRIIEPKHFGINKKTIEPDEAINLIESLDGIQGGYRGIILRGLDLCLYAAGKKSLWKRIYPYLTDYYNINSSGERRIKPLAFDLVPDLANFAGGFFVQTNEMKIDLHQQLSVPMEMMKLLPPMIPDTIEIARAPRMPSRIKIGYCGKIAPLWGIRELIEATSQERFDMAFEVHIIGDKIHSNTIEYPNFNSNIRELLESSSHVVWHGGKERKETIEKMKEMDVAWCYRSPILEIETLEISTKLIENTRLGIPSIITRNSLNENFIGEEYPLFVNSANEIKALLEQLVETNLLEDLDMDEQIEKSKMHEISSVRNRIISPFIESLFEKQDPNPKRIVINGHDMKFIGEFESYLKQKGHIVRRDLWNWGDPIDGDRSKSLLKWGEIFFSEWGLANSVWYSNNIGPQKTHFVRIHLQEINERARVFPINIDPNGVTKFIFVADHVKNTAIELFNWDKEKTCTIPNFVDVERLNVSKFDSASKTIGIVGIVPQRKRVDRALNLISLLAKNDPKWRLIIKGKDPRNIEFMKAPNRSKEMEFYKKQFKRIETDAILQKAVSWESYTPSLASWYRKVGFVLSPSDFESFHFSVADGVSSGAIPIIWPWGEAKEIYTEEWVVKNTEKAYELVMSTTEVSLDEKRITNRKLINDRFGLKHIFSQLEIEMNLVSE